MARRRRFHSGRGVTRVIYRQARTRTASDHAKGILHSLSSRPLRWVAGTLGVATVLEAVGGGGAGTFGDISAAVLNKDMNAARNVPGDIVYAVESGAWVMPAAATVIVGWISRKLRI